MNVSGTLEYGSKGELAQAGIRRRNARRSEVRRTQTGTPVLSPDGTLLGYCYMDKGRLVLVTEEGHRDCPFTHPHTRHFCGHRGCRES